MEGNRCDLCNKIARYDQSGEKSIYEVLYQTIEKKVEKKKMCGSCLSGFKRDIVHQTIVSIQKYIS
jgi:hypothetical protein